MLSPDAGFVGNIAGVIAGEGLWTIVCVGAIVAGRAVVDGAQAASKRIGRIILNRLK